MIKKLQTLLTSLAVFGMVAAPVAVPAAVYAQSEIEKGLCAGTQLNANDTSCDPANDTEANDRINNILRTIIHLFSLVVGIVSVIMIIIGGFKYITSGGNDSNVAGAKNTIVYAIIGLVVVALAQFIVRFVLSKVTTT